MFMIRLGLASEDLLDEDNYVLDEGELWMIRKRVRRLNAIMRSVIAQKHRQGTLVDTHALFNRIHDSGYRPAGVPLSLSTSYLGGLFSLDGVHPSNIGQAIVANEFIGAFNRKYDMELIPPLSPRALMKIVLNDPFVDLDGDGRVRGRPGFGLLETLAPLLGVSGDTEETLAADSLRAADGHFGQALVERYLKLKGEDIRRALTWRRQDSVRMFRDILGVL
jgi:hypothetical protein